MTSVAAIIVGIALLGISLTTRHADAPDIVVAIESWSGVILVLVGTGKLLFIDN